MECIVLEVQTDHQGELIISSWEVDNGRLKFWERGDATAGKSCSAWVKVTALVIGQGPRARVMMTDQMVVDWF